MPAPSSRALAQLLEGYFKGRSDVYALQNLDGSYRSIRRPLTSAVLNQHTKGELTVALYLLLPNSHVNLGVLDIDTKGKIVQAWIDQLLKISTDLGLKPALESSGKKGYHVWYLFNEPVEASLVRHLLVRLSAMASATSGINIRPEVFPKQVGGVDLGNHIKLPWGTHQETGRRTIFIDPSKWQAYPDWGLSYIPSTPVSEAKLKAVLQVIAAQVARDSPSSRKKPRHKGMLLCYPKMEQGVAEGGRDSVMFRLGVHYWDQGYTAQQAQEKLLAVNQKNHPPLDRKVILQKVEQAYKGRYGFGCNEPAIAQFCDPNCPIYRRRSQAGFGLDPKDWQEDPSQTDQPDESDQPDDRPQIIKIIDTDPPYFEVVVQNTALIVDHLQMLSLREFKLAVFSKLQQVPKIAMKQAQWEDYITGLLKGAEREHAPAYTTQWHQTIDLLYEWLRGTPAADSYEEVRDGRPLLENDKWYFRGQDATFQLKNRYRIATVPEDLWSRYIRLAGGNTTRRKIEGGEELDLWWVPRAQKLVPPEETPPLDPEEPTLDLEEPVLDLEN